jgi:D-amino-acid dehydrogenase
MTDQAEFAIIGAGVIGLAIALRLASEGREVAVLDPAEPGSGASYGNAGTIADYAVQPVGTPAVLRALPQLLFNRDSPLAIRPGGLVALLPWLARFLRQSLPGPAARNAAALAHILTEAGPRWDDLATEIGGASLIRDAGCLYLYETPEAARAALPDIDTRRALGVAAEPLDAGALAVLEPGLRPFAGGAMFFPGARSLTDPGRMVALLGVAARRAGVRILRAGVTGVSRDGGGVRLATSAGLFRARRVVIAAGAHAGALARMAGDVVPLDTERGYHVEFDGEEARLTRPACSVARGVYFCPMVNRLRVAGTVELGGLTAPQSPHRIAAIMSAARAVFPELADPSRTWMGFRPSMPDSLPVIGPSQAGPEVIHAFGHGHIGLTLAPVTAEIVSALALGRDPGGDIAPFRPGRF